MLEQRERNVKQIVDTALAAAAAVAAVGGGGAIDQTMQGRDIDMCEAAAFCFHSDDKFVVVNCIQGS